MAPNCTPNYDYRRKYSPPVYKKHKALVSFVVAVHFSARTFKIWIASNTSAHDTVSKDSKFELKDVYSL